MQHRLQGYMQKEKQYLYVFIYLFIFHLSDQVRSAYKAIANFSDEDHLVYEM